MPEKVKRELLVTVIATETAILKIIDNIRLLKLLGNKLEESVIQELGLHGFDPNHPSLMSKTLNGFIRTLDEFTMRSLDMTDQIKEELKK